MLCSRSLMMKSLCYFLDRHRELSAICTYSSSALFRPPELMRGEKLVGMPTCARARPHILQSIFRGPSVRQATRKKRGSSAFHRRAVDSHLIGTRRCAGTNWHVAQLSNRRHRNLNPKALYIKWSSISPSAAPHSFTQL